MSARAFPITVCILTKDEEDCLPSSLAAVRGHVEKIIVLDAESNDRTREVAEESGAEVIVRPWEGYVPARRHLLSLAETAWVLMIDADEVVKEELWEELANNDFPPDGVEGYQVRRRTVYLGRVMRRAFQPDWKTVLFRKEKASFEDRAVHETAQVDGRVDRLKSEILHHSYRSVEDHYDRIHHYAELAAADMHACGRRATWFDLRVRPAWRWFAELFVRGAVVDGLLGWQAAARSAYAVRLRFRLLHELQQADQPPKV